MCCCLTPFSLSSSRAASASPPAPADLSLSLARSRHPEMFGTKNDCHPPLQTGRLGSQTLRTSSKATYLKLEENGQTGRRDDRKADNECTWDRGLSGNALCADPPGGGDSDPLSHHLPGSFRPSGPRGCQGNSRSATQAQSMQGRKARRGPSRPALRRRSVSVARFRLASGSRP